MQFAAVGFPEIAPSFYQVGDRTKRFFDEAAVRTLFADGWRLLSLEERDTSRFEKPKVVWELIAVRDAKLDRSSIRSVLASGHGVSHAVAIIYISSQDPVHVSGAQNRRVGSPTCDGASHRDSREIQNPG